MTPGANLLRYARTLSQLKSGQIACLVRRRLLPAPSSPRVVAVSPRRAGIALRTAVARAPNVHVDRREFRFLNVSKQFSGGIDWTSADMSRLWRYNLHYFDYLHDGRPLRQGSALVSDWIGNNPPRSAPGWEPYPTSLRIVNWIKFVLHEDFAGPMPASWLGSLYRQAQWLEQNLEYDLLANHLLKNGKALFFAGAFLSGRDPERWLRKGWQILLDAALEQLLEDGGHYERSPMYHAIAVEDYLDTLNLLLGSPRALRLQADLLVAKTRAALDFLNDIAKPDGSIPLFNDSALGVAPTPKALTAYAGRLIDYRARSRGHGIQVSNLQATGYFVIRHGADMLLVDCGEVGPRYQPGHAHCDTLSFELVCDGHSLIVDSGVYDYEDSELRRHVRSTRAHNTAMVDGCEQSELWGVFRAGRRAHPIRAAAEKTSESTARFSGSHDGFAHLPGRPVHARDVDYADGVWTIVDRVSGDGAHRVDTFLHVHPELDVRRVADTVSIFASDQRLIAKIETLVPCEIALERSWYCPEFGRKQRNVAIRFSDRGPLPRTLAYRIRKQRPGCATADRAGLRDASVAERPLE